MPFKSEKQRKWMHANEPKMAKDWEKKNESPQYRKANKVDCPKCDGGGCDHCGGKGYHINEGPQKDRNELALHMIELYKMLANAKILQKRKDPKAKIYIKMIQKDLKDAEKKMAKLKKVKPIKLKSKSGMGKISHFGMESVNENSAEKAKIVKLLIKYGNNPKEVKPWVNKHYKKAKGDRSGATPAQLAQYISFLTANESVNEAERDYKAEYKKYGSSKKAKKYRAELNQYNRKKGTYGNGDGKDASHKGGKIVGFEKESVNRGRAEKSRLKKEANMPDFNPMIDNALDEVIEEYTMSRKGVIDKIATLAKANKYGNVDGTQMNGKTAKQIIAIYNHPKMKRFKRAMGDYTVDQFVDLTIKLPKVLGIKEGIMDEGQKRRASDILRKFDMAYIKFSQEVRDVMKLMDKSTGSRVDGRIINKAYGKHLIPFDDIMQSWARGQQQNPGIDEDLMNENPAAIAAAQRMVVQNKMGKKISVATAKNTSYAKSDPKAHKKAKSIWDKIKDKFSKKEGVNEGTTQMFSSSKIDKAIKIAKSMGGNMTGAVKKIEKIEKNLSKNGRVEYALQQANESVNEAGMEMGKLKDAILMFQKKIKKQGRVTNARDEEHLSNLIKLYKQMGGKGVKEGLGDKFAKKINKHGGTQVKGEMGKGVQKILKIADSGYGKVGGVTVDGMSANLFKQLYDKANDDIKQKLNKKSEKQLVMIIGRMWKKFGKNVKIGSSL